MPREILYGWGRTSPSAANLENPSSQAQVEALLHSSDATLARGLGRSYGDAAQLAGGLVLSNRLLGGISPIDGAGVVTVGAGISIDELLTVAMPQGWFVPVTPGTRHVTIGGAIAADVHGKNHHLDGSFSRHVTALRLVTPTGTHDLTPATHHDLFWATMGGMGLTGVVTEATLQLIPIRSDHVLVTTMRFDTLDEIMAEMLAHDDDFRYSVAWVDCMTRGRSMGRGILTRGDHAPSGTTPVAPRGARLTVPFTAPSGLLNSLTVRAFNELWFRSSPRHREAEPQGIGAFFHPLDGVNSWNRLYGRRGFVQYQFAVPDEAGDSVRTAIEKLSFSHVPSFLAVLKRFGPGNPGPLSFPIPGWTLALDLPVGPAKLPGLLNELDELVLTSGGRVYLAKDSRLDAATAHAMYPRLEDFRRIKESVDPEGLITSDLARRLNLLGK